MLVPSGVMRSHVTCDPGCDTHVATDWLLSPCIVGGRRGGGINHENNRSFVITQHGSEDFVSEADVKDNDRV